MFKGEIIMKKIVYSLITITTLAYTSEFEYGRGTFNMSGGFLGLTNKISTDINTFSLAEHHANIDGTNIFYSYDFTWMDSKTLKQAQHIYNNMTTIANDFNPIPLSTFNPTPLTTFEIPSMDYRVKGMDANIRLGYDVLHKGENNFLGLGMLLGISMPWIDSSSSASPSADTIKFILDNQYLFKTARDFFQKTRTDILTYKIGPSVNFQKTFISDKVSLYGTASWAYQTGYVKNHYVDSKFSVNGLFKELNLGIRYTPFSEDFKLGWLTISSNIYATLGYKYSKWDVDHMTINTSGAKMSSEILDPLKTKFGFDSSVGYMGIGYSF